MEKSKISVIIPIYNAESWLLRCLNSVLNNTYKNLEIICVNDGSTDKSLELLLEYAKKDNRIVVINQPNSGVSVARNKGLETATGEFVSFVDADDWIHRDFFKIMIEAVGETDIAYCGFIRCDRIFPDQGISNIAKHVIRLSKRQISLPRGEVWGMVCKRSVIGKIKFPLGVKMAEDKVFMLQVIKNAELVTLLECKLYYYYVNSQSAIYTYGSDLYPAAQEMLRLAKELNDSNILSDAYTKFLAHRYLNMFDEASRSIRKECNQQLKQCAKLAKIMSVNKRIILNLMAHFPLLYRIYRIVTDPTMLEWERNQRRIRRKSKSVIR